MAPARREREGKPGQTAILLRLRPGHPTGAPAHLRRPRPGTRDHPHWQTSSFGEAGMNRYIAQRVLLIIPTMFGITVVLFMAVRFLPGDVVDQILGDFGAASPETRRQLEERYSLNDSIPQQYIQ